VYARPWFDGAKSDEINESRFQLLDDQLTIYDKEEIPWSIWTYKDIGFQGMVYVDQQTPYMKLLQPLLEKKQKLATDAWGTDETYIKPVKDALLKLITDNVPVENRQLYPSPVWTFEARVSRLPFNILIAEFLVKEWAEYFRGKTEAELDELAASFKFENCVQRKKLNEYLVAHKGV